MDDIILVNEHPHKIGLDVHPGNGGLGKHHDERVRFEAVCDSITKSNPTMLELGCFWALWSIIFGKKFPDAKLIVLEARLMKLGVGLANLHANGLTATVHYNVIAPVPDLPFRTPEITMDEIFEMNKIEEIDLLHLDIQGSEAALYEEIFDMLIDSRISNVVMATHYPEDHRKIVDKFRTLPHSVYEIEPGPPGEHYSKDGEIIVSSKAIKIVGTNLSQ